MAVVTRYFGTSSAGAADGTSWANRAAFLVAGVVNTLITAFDFTSDALTALVEVGTYVQTTGLTTFTGAAAPVNANCLLLQSCDSSGNPWTPPDPGWVSAQPVWGTSGMANLTSTGNFTHIGNAGIHLYGIRFTTNGSNSSGPVSAAATIAWCYFDVTSGGTTGYAIAGTPASIRNTAVKMLGSSYNSAVNSVGVHIDNLRIEGNFSATSGNRRGLGNSVNGTHYFSRITSFNNPGGNIVVSTGSAARCFMTRCTSFNSGSFGISIPGTQATLSSVTKCMVVDSTGAGITSATAPVNASDNRLRDNTGGNTSLAGNSNTWNNLTSAGTDADEFVDHANGDLRIKNTSSLWGKGYGA
jgi:hypothetical protein